MNGKVAASTLLVLLGCDDQGAALSRLMGEPVATPNVLDFGDVALGHPAMSTLEIKNVGMDKLHIERTVMTPGDAPYVFAPMTGLEPSESQNMDVTFLPVAQGLFEAVVQLEHDGRGGPTLDITIRGNGVAPDLDVSPTQLDFGRVTVDRRAQLELVVANRTTLDTTLTVRPIDQSSVNFGVDQSAAVVPASQEIRLVVWYKPVAEGDHQAALELDFCPNCRVSIPLSGTGVKPLFTLTPSALDFGSHEERVAVTQSFVVESIGNSALTLFDLAPTPDTSAEYSVGAVVLPAVLARGEALEIEVTYFGVTPGVDVGQIAVTTDAWNDPTTAADESVGLVAVTAESTGPDINALPNPVSFGTISLDAPVQRALLIENTGNRPLAISEIVLADGAELNMTSPATPLVLEPGTNVALEVEFAPTTFGPQESEIRVTSDDVDEGLLIIPVLGSGGTPDTCSIVVAPDIVNFGLVERGRTVRLPVEIRNSGAQPCAINNVVSTGDAEFVVESAPALVPAESSAPIVVAFAPAAYGTYVGVLSFESDDPTRPAIDVPINGSSAESTIRVIPSEVDFGIVPVGCRSLGRTLTVYNTGNNTVTVTSIALDTSTSYEIELGPVSTPTALAAGTSMTLQLLYAPADIGVDYGVLFVQHSDSPVPVAVPIVGEGRVDTDVTETFQQLATPQADVLFVIDNSGSMGDEQDVLAQNLGQLMALAQTEGINYHFAVTTTDVSNNGEKGRFVANPVTGDKVLTPTTPNVQTVFESQVLVGTDGSGDEQGFQASYLALTDPLINLDNAGFLREEAMLAVVYVSDEQEQSPQPVSFYEDTLRNIKGFFRPEMFSVSAIVGTTPGGCDSSIGEADYAPRYIALAESTGGVVESICNEGWGQALANIGLSSFGLKRRFFLSSSPIPSTVTVEVDGVPTQGWVYDAASNSVIFDAGSIPPPNATVEIDYTVACF